MNTAWQDLAAASLSDTDNTLAPAMELALAASFGSLAGWREAFAACGQGLGVGWRLLVFQPQQARLVNRWAAGTGEVDGVPLLALAADDSADRIAWPRVYQRYQHAVHEASEPFGAEHEAVADIVLFDVRRAGVFEQAAALIPGARWRDPARVDAWAAELPPGSEVLVYCVYGHEVGRATALRLRAAGLKARYLRGGFDAWQAAGRPLQAKG